MNGFGLIETKCAELPATRIFGFVPCAIRYRKVFFKYEYCRYTETKSALVRIWKSEVFDIAGHLVLKDYYW